MKRVWKTFSMFSNRLDVQPGVKTCVYNILQAQKRIKVEHAEHFSKRPYTNYEF